MLSGTCFASADESQGPRVCVIAEVGVNHDGSLDRAIELTHAAADAGADAVKLQLFDPRRLLSAEADLASYQMSRGEQDAFAMLRRLQMRAEQMKHVRDAARARGLAFVVTPFSVDNVSELVEMEIDLVKIASPDAVNRPLLDACASMLPVPMIVSTGTCTTDELEHAARLVRRRGGAMLQCVSSYPTAAEDAAIGGMLALRRAFDLAVGYSDHTMEETTGALAVAAGACVIEKHLTYDRTAPGPDHAASFEPDAFARYVTHIRRAAAMLGPLTKRPHHSDGEVRRLCRQSVCAARDLAPGCVLTRDDLDVRRPGTGIPAAELEHLLGRTVTRRVSAGRMLQRQDVAELAAAG